MNRVNCSNFNATILKFSEKYKDQFSHMYIFGNMFPDSRNFVAVPIKRSNNFVSLYWLLDWDKFSHVTKHSNMRKLMVLFPRKCENPGIKIAWFNLIFITISINLFQFCTVLGSVVTNHIRRFSVDRRFVEKSMYSIYIISCLLRRVVNLENGVQ